VSKDFEAVLRAAFDAGRESTGLPLHRADAEFARFRATLGGDPAEGD
jgi:hypothetical protein